MKNLNVIIAESMDNLVKRGMVLNKKVQDPEKLVAIRTYPFPKLTKATLWFNKSKGTGFDLLNIMVQELVLNVKEDDTEEELISRTTQVLHQWKDLMKEHELEI